jgi:hypothetical protein
MNESKIFGLIEALHSITPNAEWVINGEQIYENIAWMSQDISQPSQSMVELEVQRLQSEYDVLEYQRLRALEYPPMADYLDGIVKNDQDQIQAYIDACLAVKEKYPKPSIES